MQELGDTVISGWLLWSNPEYEEIVEQIEGGFDRTEPRTPFMFVDGSTTTGNRFPRGRRYAFEIGWQVDRPGNLLQPEH